MKKRQGVAMIGHVLLKMEEMLSQKRPKHEIKPLHDAVVKYLRDEKNPAPDWDATPLARSFVSQQYP